MDPIVFASRLLHILSAIVLMGGATFTLFVLRPAAKELPEDVHEALRQRISRKWSMIIGIGILLLIVTGLYNYFINAMADGAPQKGNKAYHMVLGIKILLAFVVFFLASALAGRSQGLAWIRRDAGKWLTILVLLATIVVALGSYLKVQGRKADVIIPGPAFFQGSQDVPAILGD